MKPAGCLWLSFAIVSCVGAQRKSWGMSQNSFGSDSGWNSNSDRNSYVSNQNSGYESWDSNARPNSKDSYSTWNSFGDSDRKPSSTNSWGSSSFGSKETFGSDENSKYETESGNGSPSWSSNKPVTNSFGDSNRKPSSTNSWGSSSFGSKPTKETFGNGENSKYETESGNGSPSWSSNKPTTNKTPKKQKYNSGNSGNWESDAFSTNNRPNEKKSASITNKPNSGNWEANGFSSGGTDNGNSVYSSGGSSSNSKPSSFEDNSNSGSWGTNSFDNNNEPISNDIFSSSDYDGNSIWNNNKNSKTTTTPKPKKNYKTTPKPNQNLGSNTQNSGSWGSDYEGNSFWNNDKNSKTTTTSKPKKNYKTTPKPNQNWGSNTQNSGNSNKKKSSSDTKNPEVSDWNSNKEQNEKNPSRDEGNEKKSSAPDLSFLDDLDKNDWYFREELDYPKLPFNSNLNIDVSELWRKRNNGNNGGNKRRRNRGAGEFGGGVQCECVSVLLCDEEDAILTKADLGDDWRPIEEFLCPRFTDVCCTNPKLGHSIRGNMFQEDIGEESLRCGQRRINGNIRDNSAQPGEFPWNLRLESLEGEINCSASLIHPKMALTAAHCVESSEVGDLEARAGLWNTNGEPFQSRRITRIVAHPDYNKENPRNDIALLVFEYPFKLTDNVNTICLPVTNDKWDPNRCFVTDSTSDGEVSDGLRKGIVGFLPQYECQNIMLVTDFWRDYVLHDSFVCGIEKSGRDSCLGDEGSSVVCPSLKSPDTYLQIGIVSNSLNCDKYGRPGILTNVLKFLDWINGNAFDLGLFDDIDVRSLL